MASMTRTKRRFQAEVVERDENVPATETTRVFVSGLPLSFTSDQLKQHFSTKFQVTDAHVLADRRIGFVGFTDTGSAQNAARHFDKTYVRMSKISVDLAKPVQVSRDKAGVAMPISQKRGNLSADHGLRRKRARGDDGEELRSEQPDQERQGPLNTHTSANELDTVESENAAPSTNDVDWLRGRTTRTLDLIDADEIQIHQDDDLQESQPEKRPTSQTQDVEGADKRSLEVSNARLFIRNLAFTATEDDLRNLFAPHGKIHEVGLTTCCISVA